MMRPIRALTAAGALATAMALSATPTLSQQVTLKLHVFIGCGSGMENLSH